MEKSKKSKGFISMEAFKLLQKMTYDTLYEWVDFDNLLLTELHEAGNITKSIDVFGTHFSVTRVRR